jgi:hypothetical protein
MVKNLGNSEMRHWAFEGILVAAVPTLGYALAFAYELGFSSTFSIPIELVKIQLSNIFWGSISVLLIFGILFGLANMFFMIVQPKSRGPISLGLIRIAPALVIWLSFMFIYFDQWRIWIGPTAFVMLLAFLEFGLPLLTHESRKSRIRKREHQEEPKIPTFESTQVPDLKLTYGEKLEYQNKIDVKRRDIFDYLGSPLQKWFMALGIAFYLLFISFAFGNSHAMKQTEYLIPSTHEDSVVLRIYGNNAICTQVLRETHEINKSFFVIDISSDPSTVFKPEKVGPLKLTGTETQ